MGEKVLRVRREGRDRRDGRRRWEEVGFGRLDCASCTNRSGFLGEMDNGKSGNVIDRSRLFGAGAGAV